MADTKTTRTAARGLFRTIGGVIDRVTGRAGFTTAPPDAHADGPAPSPDRTLADTQHALAFEHAADIDQIRVERRRRQDGHSVDSDGDGGRG